MQQAMQIPEWRSALGNVLAAILQGRYPRWFLDFVVQRGRGDFDSFDAYAIGSIMARYRRGELSFVRIPLGSEPCADREREENQREENQRLLTALPAPFAAIVDPDDRGDGVLTQGKESVPLEIGTTASSRTLMHLEFQDGLARWAYFSTEVILARKTNKWVHWSKGLL